MPMSRFVSKFVAACGLLGFTATNVPAADWPQYMGNAARNGDAASEDLASSLGLVAQVRLDDAVTTSPAVVDGRAYVVDQMGTAYCIDPTAGKILWKTSPEGDAAYGANTSSPCVANGRVYYGTTAGNLYVLDAESGEVVRSVDLGASIIASPALANERLYLQTVAAVVHCFDFDGDIVWKWDHYEEYEEPNAERFEGRFPHGYNRPNYGGGDVAVSGKKLVTSIGWDHLCLEDAGDRPKLVWCNRAALGKDDGVPRANCIVGDVVHTPYVGIDGAGSLLRVSLADGSFDQRKDQRRGMWAILGTPAARGKTVYVGQQVHGVQSYEHGKGTQWHSFSHALRDDETPILGSCVLSKNHCLFATTGGELIAVPLDAKGTGLQRMEPEPFRFRTPHEKVIATTPAISDGRVFFGCDDGFLYVLGEDGDQKPRTIVDLDLHERREETKSATGAEYAWPSPNGDVGNTRFVADEKLAPPFDMRWSIRSFGIFHTPMSATEKDIIYMTKSGLICALEQETARIRWRHKLPRQRYGSHGLLCVDGRIYAARSDRESGTQDALFCLEQSDGRELWRRDVGRIDSGFSKAPAIVADGVVAFASLQGAPLQPVVEAWDAATGEPMWTVSMTIEKAYDRQRLNAPTGCAMDGVMFFSSGGKTDDKPEQRYPGETIAIEAKTGKVLWRTREAFTTAYSNIAARDGRLYVFAYAGPMTCLSAKDGSVVWRSEREYNYFQHGPTLGTDFFAVKGYGGHTSRYSLADCTPQKGKLGGTEHTCASALLTSGGLSILPTVGGLYVRDAESGELLWLSPKGFGGRNCANPAVTNGRIYVNPQVNGMIHCFEPASANAK